MNSNYKWYLASPEGEAMTRLFSFEDEFDKNYGKIEQIFNLTKDFLNYSDTSDVVVQNLFSNTDDFCRTINDFLDAHSEIATQEEFYEAFIKEYQLYQWYEDENTHEWKQGPVWLKADDFRSKASTIAELSLAMSFYFTEVDFYPILFRSHFYEFVDRCNVLGIQLPDIPLQKDKYERCMLYYEINKVLDDFKKENNLSKEQVCALLYGYAPTIINENRDTSQKAELPSPSRIWFVGAAKDDYDTSLKQDTCIWQGNEETLRGDIVVIYALSPHSCIHSVWRAIKDGGFNPFDYYCSRTEVGCRIEVPHITFKELKDDKYTSQIPIVRKNLQGINGVELSIEDYKNLQRLFAEKGFDNSVLPQIERPNLNLNVPINLEKDVEEQILIPVLSKLGYSDEDGEDWKRQVLIKLGRNEKYIPDFVFFPQEVSSRQVRAPFIIEAKLDFRNAKQFHKDFEQAVSYARPLEADFT